MDNQDYIMLKWGTLKSWRMTNKKGKELLKKYYELGVSLSAAAQEDTFEQKKLICKLIDIVPDNICLDWDGEYVSKEEAKKYVMEYDKKRNQSV